MFADYHVHSHFSEDTDFPMELEIQKAIKLGMDELCFTEHSDYDVPTVVNCDYDAYFEEMEKMKDKYKGQITLKTGIEFGIQTHTTKAYEETFRQYPFDFVIFSCHQVENKEYWRQEPQEGKTQLEYNRRYYQEILDVVKVYKDYSILGHLDVIKRYDKQGEIEFEKIQDLIEQIFEVVIADGKGIELNTSSRAYKLKSLMPSKEILKLYHDMGGKIITIGSDAHNADRIGDCVMESQKILKDIGFDGMIGGNGAYIELDNKVIKDETIQVEDDFKIIYQVRLVP